jgi:hypothetical protein
MATTRFFSTGRGSAVVVAGFEGNVEGRIFCIDACIIDGIDFRVGFSSGLMISFSYNVAVLDDDRTHHGVW